MGFFTKPLAVLLAAKHENRCTKTLLKLWMQTHLKVAVYLSWMLIPVLISFPYFGGAVEKPTGGFQQPSLMWLFVNGGLFDTNRKYYCMTALVCIGMLVALIRSYSFTKADAGNHILSSEAIFTFWIVAMSIVSVLIFTGTFVSTIIGKIIPNGMMINTSNNKALIIGIQFSASLLIGLALEKIIQILTRILAEDKRKYLKTAAVFFLAVILIANGADRVTEETTSLMELSDDFQKALTQVAASHRGGGRILTSAKLGIFLCVYIYSFFGKYHDIFSTHFC